MNVLRTRVQRVPHARLQKCATRERGFTLVEVLVVMILIVIVLGAILAFADTGSQLSSKDNERNTALISARTGLYTMTRELREGYPPTGGSLSVVDTNSMDVIVNTSTAQRVAYDCSIVPFTGATYRQCKRWAASAASATSPEPTTLSARQTTGAVVVDRITGPTNTFSPTNLETITATGAPTGGTFTLTYAINSINYSTGNIQWSDSAASVASAVQSALVSASGLSGLTVTGRGGPLPGNPVVLAFRGAGTVAIPAPTVNSNLNGGVTPSVTATAPAAVLYRVNLVVSVKGNRVSGYQDSTLRDAFYMRNLTTSSL